MTQRPDLSEVEAVYKAIGSRLREIRKSRGVSQRELAEKVGVCRSTITNVKEAVAATKAARNPRAMRAIKDLHESLGQVLAAHGETAA